MWDGSVHSPRRLERINAARTRRTNLTIPPTPIPTEVSRVSRVAVIGPNGAGKSTAIKLLIGELTPTSGSITKHPNMRLAYVAQHAFFHLEKHLNETPAQYIMWRFAGNEDKESIELLLKKVEKDDKEVRACLPARLPRWCLGMVAYVVDHHRKKTRGPSHSSMYPQTTHP
jgi:ATPase subunit of ABC transporter with duplicated ATPase domains